MDISRVNRTNAILGIGLAACYASAADATIIYNTPVTTNISTQINDNIQLDDALAIVNVNSNGIIRGVNDPSLGIFNTAARTRNGTLNVTGTGRIIAAAGQSAINMAGGGSVVRLQNRATVTGDVVNEFTTTGWRNESTAITRFYMEDRARVIGDVSYAGFMRVQDRAQIIGSIINPANGSFSLDMRGGSVSGVVQMGGLNDYVFNMSGGTIHGGVRGAAGYVDMTMTGGHINNGIRTGDFVTADIFGGSIDGGIDIHSQSSGAASHLMFDGGALDADPGQYLFSMSHENFGGGTLSSSVDIYGGEFGYLDQGLGFFLDNWVDFTIYGWNLAFSGGILSGYLSDGSWFENPFTFGSGWSGTFNIVNLFPLVALSEATTLSAADGAGVLGALSQTQSVPEPGTLGMLAACGIGMMIFRRRQLAAGALI